MENENINEIEVVIPVNKAIVVDSRVTDVRALLRIPDDMEIEYGNKYRLSFSSKAKLVFEKDGIIDFSCTVVGNDTVLVAPIAKIFGNGVAVEGSWKIDRAYPQWFYDDSSMTDAEKLLNADWSGAINSAILMKRTGEVFIPRGDYYVKSPINVRIGINLIGETGVWQRHTDASDGLMQEYTEYGHRIFGTTILSTFANDTKHKDEESGNDTYYPLYVLTVNEKSTPQEFEVDIIAQMSTGGVIDPSEPAEPVEPAVGKKTRLVYETDISGMPQGTSVRNIEFVNYYAMSCCDNDNDFTSQFGPDGAIKEAYHYVYGAIASQGICFDNVIWRGYRQAVKFENIYSDAKEIRNCCYYFDKGIYQNLQEDKRPEPMYAFDMGFLGDAFLFLHNTVHDGWYNNGLRINCCGGAFIADNIMNSDVLIESCKGVEFKSNHIEGGHTITVIASQANICSNYIEKRTQPPFIFADRDESNKDSRSWGDKNIIKLDGNIILYIDEDYGSDEAYEDFTKQTTQPSESDLSIGMHCIITINNTYCYRTERDNFGKMYPSGIRIVKRYEPQEVFGEFNDFSHFLSHNSIIGPNYNIQKFYQISGLNDPKLECQMTPILKDPTSKKRWIGPTGYYEYYYQLIWDKGRNITKHGEFMKNYFKAEIIIPGEEEDTIEIKNRVQMVKAVSGKSLFILKFSNANLFGCCMLVRIVRYKFDTEDSINVSDAEMVEIPVCGTEYLYDNGNSVNGFTWGQGLINGNNLLENNPNFLPSNQNIHSICYHGYNVTCYGTNNNPSGYGWRTGDMIISDSDDTDWDVKIIK